MSNESPNGQPAEERNDENRIAPTKEVVTATQISAKLDLDGPGRDVNLRLSPVQDAAYRLIVGLSIFAGGVAVLVLTGWIILTLRSPEQGDAIIDRALKLFDGMVTKVVVPILTAIVAYLFGRQDSNKQS